MPAAQLAHAVQLEAFEVVLNCPEAQAAQVRLVVALPPLTTYCPAGQVVLLMQGVAGSWSSSQVEELQATDAAVPPAQ